MSFCTTITSTPGRGIQGPAGSSNFFATGVLVDFGFQTGQEGDLAKVTLTGMPGIIPQSIILCTGFGLETDDHDPDDTALEGIVAYAENIIPGVGFDVVAKASGDSGTTWGKYYINVLVLNYGTYN